MILCGLIVLHSVFVAHLFADFWLRFLSVDLLDKNENYVNFSLGNYKILLF